MRTFLLLILIIPLPLFAQWQEFSIRSQDSVWASSVFTEILRGSEVSYTPENLFDQNNRTPWVEGSPGNGIGEYVTILTNSTVSAITIVNGFALSGSVYLKNGRVKTLGISFLAGFSPPGMVSENDYYLYFLKEYKSGDSTPLPDSPELYTIPFPFSSDTQEQFLRTAWDSFRSDKPDLASMITESVLGQPAENNVTYDELKLIYEIHGFIGIRLYIDSVYPGSRYTDTCISEISVHLDVK